ncbi:MAG: hypothetical protein KAH10_04545 [Flavobacteriales bacterium]|nr:hypothetical protein [Flavobacteriales bacterium]
MKNIILKMFGLILLIGLAVVGCTKDSDAFDDLIDTREYPVEVTNIVPIDFIHKMVVLGMPIFKGENPPNIEGVYKLNQLVLLNSNITDDLVGYDFDDVEIYINKQYNDLSLMMNYKCGCNDVRDIEACIIGDGRYFTIFAKVTVMENNSPASYICVMSGKIINFGIIDTYISRFMFDDFGDSRCCLIEIGEGRVLIDKDRFSERID